MPRRPIRQGAGSIGPHATRAEIWRPLLFLDFDDVICINSKYGSKDLAAAPPPPDLWTALFHEPAVATLRLVAEQFHPAVVITTNWLRFLDRDGVEGLFRRTGLDAIADSLHPHWDAPQDRGATRLSAINAWLSKYHRGEALVVLDDELSGTGLRGSSLHRKGCVVLCEVGVGLHRGHLPLIEAAFGGRQK
jgi:hypothetical protein